jgi:ketosteroid isomerase-like protein
MSKREATVRDFFDALNRDDATDLEVFDPDVEFNVGDDLPDPQTFHGQEGVSVFFEGLREVWDDLRAEPDEVVEVGDRVLIGLRQIGYGKGSGARVEQKLYPVWQMRGGTVVRSDVYFDRRRALEAVGLRE